MNIFDKMSISLPEVLSNILKQFFTNCNEMSYNVNKLPCRSIHPRDAFKEGYLRAIKDVLTMKYKS